jgi:hypothetical protein
MALPPMRSAGLLFGDAPSRTIPTGCVEAGRAASGDRATVRPGSGSGGSRHRRAHRGSAPGPRVAWWSSEQSETSGLPALLPPESASASPDKGHGARRHLRPNDQVRTPRRWTPSSRCRVTLRLRGCDPSRRRPVGERRDRRRWPPGSGRDRAAARSGDGADRAGPRPPARLTMLADLIREATRHSRPGRGLSDAERAVPSALP